MSQKQTSNYLGIDLGTSNCAVAIADEDHLSIGSITQKTSADEQMSIDSLPSFLFIQPNGDIDAGAYAKQLSFDQTERVITSAKSWLSVADVDRNDKILPWQSNIEHKLSPVEASERLLSHIRENCTEAKSQEYVVLTIPASFDEQARKLTASACEHAGFSKVTLLEEPLAALYSWLAQNEKDWRKTLTPGDLVLVFDVGGGTTDFSLVAISENDGELNLERIAVGPHLLLGGDNIDLFVAVKLQEDIKAKGHTLDSMQFRTLVQLSRTAKEQLLNTDQEDYHISLAGGGSDLFASTISHTVSGSWLRQSVRDSFFPTTAKNERPDSAAASLTEFGLPYAQDPIVTKHLNRFLFDAARKIKEDQTSKLSQFASDENTSDLIFPSHILFNGGSTAAAGIQEQILNTFRKWFDKAPSVLPGNNHYQAVAEGAAYYHRLKAQGTGIKIKAKMLHSFYLEVEGGGLPIPGMPPAKKAICLVPQGSEEGATLELPAKIFTLRTGEKRSFHFYSSADRPEDSLGSIVEDPANVFPSKFTLSTGIESHEEVETIKVSLSTYISEAGVLQVYLNRLTGDQSWQLELDTRS